MIVKSKAKPGSLPLTKVSPQLGAMVWKGDFHSALIGKQDGGSYAVHPLGRSSKPGPYFLTDRLPRDSLHLPGDGPPLLVEQNGTWFPARLLGPAGDKYKVHYLGNKKDEVVTKDRVKYPFVGKP